MGISFGGYIGMFDSGVGGLSVLKRAVELMPCENYLFFGDSANTPYGEKPPAWILSRSRQIAERMIEAGCKAIVIACNTATAVAADALRAEHPELPIVGVEPALKPAVLKPSGEKNRILVMATPVTISQDKFHELYRTWAKDAEVSVVGCTGLAARIEQGNFDAPDMRELLERLVGEYAGKVDSVVLGCTHYPFVKKQILEVLGPHVEVFDGGAGTARQIKRLLSREGALAPDDAPRGRVVFKTSATAPDALDLYHWLYRQPL